MNTLLYFFALPLLVIIISIALQKIFNNPALVAAIIFSIFLVVTVATSNTQYLIATVIYSIISYITAILTNVITKIIQEIKRRENRPPDPCRPQPPQPPQNTRFIEPPAEETVEIRDDKCEPRYNTRNFCRRRF